MAKIEWSDIFSLGVQSLDDQHKRFIELGNTILLAVRAGQTPRQIAAHFSKLREYTVYHFLDEEAFMRSVDYPELKAHIQEHEELKRLVRYHQEKLFKEKLVREKDVLEFLKRLLVDHVIYTDLKVKRFLNGKTPRTSMHQDDAGGHPEQGLKAM